MPDPQLDRRAFALARVNPGATDRADRHRRELLATSDRLLGEIEELRLARSNELPPLLRRRIRNLLVTMGQAERGVPPSVRGAHHLLFAIQQRLMAANPRRPSIAAVLGRPAGMPAVSPIRPGLTWKLLGLPADPGSGREGQWLAMIDATVERAFDRWAYAHHHALRTVRRHEPATAALAVDRVAWNNYWQLSQESARIRRARAGPGERT